MNDETRERSDPVPAGEPAPDFTLPSGPGRAVTLSELKGRPVILAFYPAAFSPTCDDQMTLYQSVLDRIEERGARLLGISVDGPWCHAAFAETRNLTFPQLSDFEPKGGVARSFGVYRPDDGVSERALFVLDSDGVVRWSHVSPIGVNPGVDGILQALDSLDSPGSRRDGPG